MTLAELERHLLDTIPLAQAMELRVAGYEAGELRLCAPLAPNRNDKGCAFGGSKGLLTYIERVAPATPWLAAQGAASEVS